MRMEQTDRQTVLRRGLSALLALVLVWAMLPAVAETSYGVVTGDKVLFRKATSGSDYYDYLNKGWVAKILDEVKANKYSWYKVEANTPTNPNRTYTGYIRADYFRRLTAAEEAAWLVNKPQPDPALAGIVSPVTDKPESGATPTPTPKAESKTNPPVLSGDYGLVVVSGANLRKEPAGQSLTALTKDALVKILAFPSSGNPWYKVDFNGQQGYLQTDHLRALSPSELAAYQQTSAPVTTTTGTITTTPAPSSGEASGTLKITKTSTNLRKEPGGTSLFQYAIGTELPFFGAPVFSLGYTWAKVVDSGRKLSGYIRSDCYEIVTGGQVTAPPAPTAVPTGSPSSASVRVTLGGTNLRQAPGGTPIAVLDRGRILPFYGSPSAQGGYNWVYVWDEKSQLYGYVRSDCYEFVSGAPQPVVTPSPTPTGSTAPAAGSLTLTKGGVNLRNAPGGQSFAQLDKGLTMNYFSFAVAGGYTWYMVDSPKGVGYVRSDVIQLTAAPTDSPVVTTQPSAPPAPALGYLITVKSEINLRKTASSGSQVLGRVDKAQVLALTGPTQSANGYNWFRVTVNGLPGYLRGDCVRQLTQEEINNWINHGKMPDLSLPDPNAPLPTSGYVLTTTTSVNVRASTSMDARVLGQVASAGAVFPLLATINAGGRLWYKVSFQGQEGYLLSSVARMMNQKEYEDYISTQPTPSPTPAPTPTPPPEQMSQTAITRMTNVIIRSGAGASNRNLGIIYRRGTVVALRGETSLVENETWFAVRASGINGWIRGDLLRVLTLEEEKALNATGDPDAPKPATYRSLRIGDRGEDVTRLQQELIRRSLLGSSGATGTYDSQTAEAVRSFQRANSLTVDGIAGSQTQHKIYGTVPEDTYEPGGGSTVVPGLYPVELVDWNKGDISTFWGKGEVAIMTDVTTGISLRIKRWSGGSHVDGEPLTAADTAALCRIYGVKNAQEILERNLYQRRPLWITLKGRSFAASLYGVPHNYPQGDTIADNEFNGQLCIHFYNSRVHTSGTVDRDHMRAIQKAYDLAPSKK